MKYYIIAGEASGDLHGSNLMKSIYSLDKEAHIRFWGGDKMQAIAKEKQSEYKAVIHYKDMAIMGFTKVISQIIQLKKRLKFCESDILNFQPDKIILIDYPGFNLRIAKFAHNHDFEVSYYIAPKVWASREYRIKLLKKYVNKLIVVFPFEIEYFKSKDVNVFYCGNPLIDEVKERYNGDNSKSIALLAGSRKSEQNSMLATYMEFADKLHNIDEYKDYNFIIAAGSNDDSDVYSQYLKGREGYVKVVYNQTHKTISESIVAVVNSGTASLETALIGCPQVVCYNLSNLNYTIGKHIIKVNYISLGNLIMNKPIYKELIQHYFTANNLCNEVIRLIEDKEYRERIMQDYKQLKEILGAKHIVSDEVSKHIIA